MEPWDGLRLAPAELFASLRSEHQRGIVRRGRLRLDLLESRGEVEWQRDAERVFPIRASDATLLGVKWPSYWQLIGMLAETKFIACVRDPAEVEASFVAEGGRLAEGLDYDTAFTRALNQRLLAEFEDAAARRVALIDAAYERILAHADDPNVFVVRYERWFGETTALLGELSDFLGADVTNTKVALRQPKSAPATADARRVRAMSRTAAQLGYT